MNSGPSSLATDVKVLSSVDMDSTMNMRLTMENTAVPKIRVTAEGWPAFQMLG